MGKKNKSLNLISVLTRRPFKGVPVSNTTLTRTIVLADEQNNRVLCYREGVKPSENKFAISQSKPRFRVKLLYPSGRTRKYEYLEEVKKRFGFKLTLGFHETRRQLERRGYGLEQLLEDK